MDNVITYASQPVYDSWGYTDNLWSAYDWMLWYEALRDHYGEGEANYRWSKAWLAGVSSWGGGTGEAPGADFANDSVPVGERTTNASFREFLNNNKVLYDAVFSGALGSTVGVATSTAVGAGQDAVGAVGAVVGNVAGAVKNTSSVLKYAVPAVLVIVLGIGVYIAVNNAKNIKLAK